MLPALTLMVGMFLVPLAIVIEQSLVDASGAPSLEGYRELFESRLFRLVLGTTLEINVTATAVSLLVAYPFAYHLALQPPRRRMILSALVLLPFWTSILVKSFAF